MPRQLIAYEGLITSDGRVIEPGVLTWDDPIPLLISMNGEGHFGSVILGKVTDITRSIDSSADQARILGTLSHPIRGMAPEIDLDPTEHETGPFGLMIVRAGRIRAVTLGLRPCWPGLVIE
jgi:hypothetical protein